MKDEISTLQKASKILRKTIIHYKIRDTTKTKKIYCIEPNIDNKKIIIIENYYNNEKEFYIFYDKNPIKNREIYDEIIKNSIQDLYLVIRNFTSKANVFEFPIFFMKKWNTIIGNLSEHFNNLLKSYESEMKFDKYDFLSGNLGKYPISSNFTPKLKEDEIPPLSSTLKNPLIPKPICQHNYPKELPLNNKDLNFQIMCNEPDCGYIYTLSEKITFAKIKGINFKLSNNEIPNICMMGHKTGTIYHLHGNHYICENCKSQYKKHCSKVSTYHNICKCPYPYCKFKCIFEDTKDGSMEIYNKTNVILNESKFPQIKHEFVGFDDSKFVF